MFSGCFGLGLWYREQMNGRIRALRMLEGILELLASHVRYGRSTLPECCRQTAPQLEPCFRQAFTDVADMMEKNTGASFAEVFRDRLREPLRQLPLTEEDCEIFLGFASETGYADGLMQLRAIEQSVGRIEETARRLKKDHADKSRIAVGLGAMGGLLLIIILW